MSSFDCLTDGKNAIYGRCCYRTYHGGHIFLNTGSAEERLTAAPMRLRNIDGEHAVNNGWAAYIDKSASGKREIWLRTPAGKKQQVTSWGGSVELLALGGNGDVIVYNYDAKYNYFYLFDYGAQPRPVFRTYRKPKQINGKWYLAIGRTLFEVLPRGVFPDAGVKNDAGAADGPGYSMDLWCPERGLVDAWIPPDAGDSGGHDFNPGDASAVVDVGLDPSPDPAGGCGCSTGGGPGHRTAGPLAVLALLWLFAVRRAAELLGIQQSNLSRMMKSLGLR